jgi:hypothetical protein
MRWMHKSIQYTILSEPDELFSSSKTTDHKSPFYSIILNIIKAYRKV